MINVRFNVKEGLKMNFVKLAKSLFILGFVVGSLTTFSYSANANYIVKTVDTTQSFHYILTPSRVYFMELFEEFCNSIITNEANLASNISSSIIWDITIMDQRVNEAILSVSDPRQLKEYIKSTITPVVDKLNISRSTQYKNLILVLDCID